MRTIGQAIRSDVTGPLETVFRRLSTSGERVATIVSLQNSPEQGLGNDGLAEIIILLETNGYDRLECIGSHLVMTGSILSGMVRIRPGCSAVRAGHPSAPGA